MEFRDIFNSDEFKSRLNGTMNGDACGLYEACKDANSKLTPDEFKKFLRSYCEKLEKTSEDVLEKVAGGKMLDKNVSKKLASLMLGTLTLGSTAGVGMGNSSKASAAGVGSYRSLEPSHGFSWPKEKVVLAESVLNDRLDNCYDILSKISDEKKKSEIQDTLDGLKVKSQQPLTFEMFRPDKRRYDLIRSVVLELELVEKKIQRYLREQDEEIAHRQDAEKAQKVIEAQRAVEAQKAKEEREAKEIEEKRRDLVKRQDQMFNNVKMSIRTSLSILRRSLEDCTRDVKDATLKETFDSSVKGFEADIDEQIKRLETTNIRDEIRNDDMEAFNQNLGGYFSEFRAELESLTRRRDKLINEIVSANEIVKRQYISEKRDQFKTIMRDTRMRIDSEFDTQDITGTYLGRLRELREDIESSFKDLCEKLNSVSRVDEVSDGERSISLFNAQLNRSIASKNIVFNEFRLFQKNELLLDAKTNERHTDTLLRNGEITLEDVYAGNETAIGELNELMQTCRDYSINPKGVLRKGLILVGSPGTGKTSLVRRYAAAKGVQLFSVRAGATVKEVKDIINQARTSGHEKKPGELPNIVLVDECDGIFPDREKYPDLAGFTTAMLPVLDSIQAEDHVVLVGTTNRIDALDKAAVRPERLDRQVSVSNMDSEQVRKVASVKLKGYRLEGQMSPEEFMEPFIGSFVGRSGAFIGDVIHTAATQALKRTKSGLFTDITLYRSDIKKQLEKDALSNFSR